MDTTATTTATTATTTAIPTADGPAEASHRLAALLDQAAGLGPEYGPGLSSHLPMALAALAALGADDARLQQYFDHASTAFGAHRPPVTPHSLGAAWTSLRGRIDAFDALAAHFAASLAQEGVDRVLRGSLPGLLDGVCAAAFHGLIRVAYAAQAGRPAELAAALAYWGCRWLPLPRPGAGVELEPDAWCERLLAAPTLPRPAGASITARVEAVVGNASYATLAGRLRAAAGDDHAGAAEQLARLAGLAVERYLCSLQLHRAAHGDRCPRTACALALARRPVTGCRAFRRCVRRSLPRQRHHTRWRAVAITRLRLAGHRGQGVPLRRRPCDQVRPQLSGRSSGLWRRGLPPRSGAGRGLISGELA